MLPELRSRRLRRAHLVAMVRVHEYAHGGRLCATVRPAWHVGRQREWRHNLSAAGLDLGAGFAGEPGSGQDRSIHVLDQIHPDRK
jgi:hypothetical protein